MKKIPITIALILLLTFSCKQAEKTNEKLEDTPYTEIKMDLALKSEKSLALSSIASSIRYVPLQTKNECLLSDIYKALFEDNKIIIVDPKMKGLFLFDNKTGKLIAKNHFIKGRGPREVLQLSGYTIDRTNKLIEVKDGGNSKMLKFNFEGNFISEKKYRLRGNYGINKLSDGNYFVYASNNTTLLDGYRVGIYDNNFKLLKRMLPIKTELEGASFLGRKITVFGRGYNIHPELCDTIYHVNENGGLQKSYYINFGDNKIPEKLFKQYHKAIKNTRNIAKAHNQFNKKFITDRYAKTLSGTYETNNVLIFLFKYSRTNYAFYNKNTRNVLIGYYDYQGIKGVINDVDHGLFGMPIATTAQNELVTVIYPNDLLNHLQKIKKKVGSAKWQQLKRGKMKNLLKLASTLDKMDNPIFMFIKFKDF